MGIGRNTYLQGTHFDVGCPGTHLFHMQEQLIRSAKQVLFHDLHYDIETGFLDDEQIYEACLNYLCSETNAQERTSLSKIEDFAHEISNFLQAYKPKNPC